MNRIVLVFFTVVSVVLAAAGFASAKPGKPRGQRKPAATQAYASVDECIILKKLDEATCRTAFANARAEFEEKIPHFPTRSACEAFFAQCSITQATGVNAPLARADYAPALERVSIVDGKTGEKRAVPVTRATRVSVRFAARALTQPEVEISPKRSAEARRQWQAAMAASLQRVNSAAAGPDGAPSFADTEGATATDTPPSFPVSKQRWQQMQGAIDRIKQQQKPSTKP